MMRETAYLILPCANISSIGPMVRSNAEPQCTIELIFKDGGGGTLRGDEAENGINDARLGSRREDGIRFSCWRIANIRKWRVM